MIIGVDLVASRIELAKSIGATKGLNTTGIATDDLAAAFKEAAGGLGPTIVVDSILDIQLSYTTLHELTCSPSNEFASGHESRLRFAGAERRFRVCWSYSRSRI